jgi:hypothetical protein
MAIDVEPDRGTQERRPGRAWLLRLGRTGVRRPRPQPANGTTDGGFLRAPAHVSLSGRPDPDHPGRRVGPAGRVLLIGLVCFGVWALLAAPALLHAAQTSPLGARRTASMTVLRPLARITAFLSLDRVQTAADRALGRPARPPGTSTRVPVLPVQTEPPPSTSHPQGRRVSGQPVPPPAYPLTVHRPSRANPVRVLIVGDSIGSDLGVGLGRMLDEAGGFVTRIDARESTGLARSDYFNWPYQIGLDVSAFRPDVVVIMIGANDAQSVSLPGGHWAYFGTPQWQSAYRARVAGIMGMLTQSQRPVVWVGMPIMGRPGLNPPLQTIDGIDQDEARQHSGVLFVDAWTLFANSRGQYSAYLSSSSGAEQLVRTADGIHLTGDGEARLGRAVYQAMLPLWEAK